MQVRLTSVHHHDHVKLVKHPALCFTVLVVEMADLLALPKRLVHQLRDLVVHFNRNVLFNVVLHRLDLGLLLVVGQSECMDLLFKFSLASVEVNLFARSSINSVQSLG